MSPSLTTDAARALSGPAWLSTIRVAAAERATVFGLPNDAIEEWRYSRIGELDLGRYALASPETTSGGSAVATATPHETTAASVDIVDGGLVAVMIADGLEAKGLSIATASSSTTPIALPEWSAPEADHLDAATHSFVDYTRAFGDPVVVTVPAGMVLDAPIVIRSHVGADGVVVFPHVVVAAGPDSEVRIVEWVTSDDVDSLVVPLLELELGPAARLTHESVQELGPRVVQIAEQRAVVAQSATHRTFHAALGGARARTRVDVDLVGRGAHSAVSALYLGGGEQVHDLRTFMSHLAQDTTSDIEARGAVDDHSHAIYTGLIRITPDGKGARAEQANRIVKLSPEAWAESVPNLEIEHNDVRCSHASTVGPIDPDQQFYLESRGVPTDIARRLVVGGFFQELLGRRAGGDVAMHVGEVVIERLGGAR